MKAATIRKLEKIVPLAFDDPKEAQEVWDTFNRGRNLEREERDKLLKTKEACQLAQVTWKTLRGWELKGYIHARRITQRRIRWSRRELVAFLEGGAAGTAEA